MSLLALETGYSQLGSEGVVRHDVAAVVVGGSTLSNPRRIKMREKRGEMGRYPLEDLGRELVVE